MLIRIEGFVRISLAHHGQHAQLNKQEERQDNKQAAQHKAGYSQYRLTFSTATTAAMTPIHTKLMTLSA